METLDQTQPCCTCGKPTPPPSNYHELLAMAGLMKQFAQEFGWRVPPVQCNQCESSQVQNVLAELQEVTSEDILIDRAKLPPTIPDAPMGPGFAAFIADRLQKPGLYIHGPTGCGKTLKAANFVRAWIRKNNQPALYRTEPQLFRLLRDFKGDAANETYRLATVPLLVIDDLGTAYDSQRGWIAEKMFEIIDSRYQDQRLRTVIISNAPLDELVDNDAITYIDGRIKRRILEICAVVSA